MTPEHQQLEAGIAALEAQRALLGDAVVDTSVAGLRARLAALTAALANVAGSDSGQSLRQVSILFLDMVGSTALSQRLDPETVSAVMDGALARGTAIVQAHHGRVLQYAGDNILAAFGADESQEDDADRAVHCGLALLALGRELGAEVLAAHGHAGVNVRVGIHTGGVLLGGGVDAEGTIRGNAVNIAARMEQTAPAGGLRISHDTYAQVRGLFEVEPQDALPVKGVAVPVQSYLVTRAKPRSFRLGSRGIEGVATRMVAREAELEVLQDAFKRLFSEGRLAAVTVVADAGIGKSRLLYEFEAWSETRPESYYVFRGRATPQTQGQPYGLLRDILAWRFQINDDDSLDAARTKMEHGIVPLFEPDDGAELAQGHAHLLGHLIGIEWRHSPHLRGILDDTRQIRNRAFHAAAQLFRRLAAQGGGTPVVMWLEDLHWADNESLDFLNYLTEVDRDVAMLVLSSARPTLFERRTDWRSTEGLHQRIDLLPLDKTGSRLLAAELLKKLPEVPAALREMVIAGSEGNPFYMEELVKMLIDQGAIRTGRGTDEAWRLDADKLLATQVPATLTGVLQARLDGLPAAEKLALQEASVIGHVFWDQALYALDSAARASLPRLVQRELTLPRADAVADGLREYSFKHVVLHQVTYGTVLKRRRRELHGRLAHWLAAQTGLRAQDFLGLTAEHFEAAGDRANAAEFHARAAEHANGRYAHEATLLHVQRALDLLEADTTRLALRWRLLSVREVALDLQGRRDGQRDTIESLARVADALGDDRLRADAAWRRSVRALRIADWPAQAEAAQWGLALAERAGADELRLLCLRLLALATAYQGDRDHARTLAEQALREARVLGMDVVQIACCNTLSNIASMGGDVMAGLEFDRETLDASRRIGHRRGEAVALMNVGNALLNLGEATESRDKLEAALRLNRINGDRAMEGQTLCRLSCLALRSADDAGALRLARTALDILGTVQARDGEAGAWRFLADAEAALGRYEAAADGYRCSIRIAQEIGDAESQREAGAGLARVALAQSDLASAMTEVEALVAQHEAGGGSSFGDRIIEFTCYQVLAAAGDARADEWLSRGHERLQAQAAAISDPALRQSFLHAIPAHRSLVQAWAARQGCPAA